MLRGWQCLGFASGMNGCDIPCSEPCSKSALLSSFHLPSEAVLLSYFRTMGSMLGLMGAC